MRRMAGLRASACPDGPGALFDVDQDRDGEISPYRFKSRIAFRTEADMTGSMSRLIMAALICTLPLAAAAQTAPAPGSTAAATAGPEPTAPATKPDQPLLKAQELDQLLA